MITSKNGRMADTDNYIHGCFMVRVGTQFNTYQEITKYAQGVAVEEGQKEFDSAMTQIINSVSDEKGMGGNMPEYWSKRKCRDTSLGGNDAINPLPQFGIDDDIMHPHYGVTDFNTGVGMGRVYSENFDDNQQILYLGFGIPNFSNIGSFWKNAVSTDLANYVNKGANITASQIGHLIGATPVVLLKLATIPQKFIAAFTNGLQEVPITKYYTFSSQMPMYFRFVNTILVNLAVNMNMMVTSDEFNDTGSNVSTTKQLELTDKGTQATGDVSGMPSFIRDYGLDMAQLMTKRYFYENPTGKEAMKLRKTDEAVILAWGRGDKKSAVSDVPDANVSTNPDGSASTDVSKPEGDGSSADFDKVWTLGWLDSFAAAYNTAIYDGHLFIGFRIDKGMGATESFSNNTGESQAAQIANEKFQEGRSMSFNTMEGQFGNSSWLSSSMSALSAALKSTFEGAASTFKLDPLAATLTGAAKVDIPDVWNGSGWSRSANFSLTCLAPYGDVETIFQSEYVPLACLLAGTLPRGTGHASHSSPFVCQAYCKGLFSSPLCIIESLEVTRGADQFGFNAMRLPLKLQINVTLKDLSPSMYMNMGGDEGIVKAIMGTDSNFGEYMLTLSGMGLRDRLAPFRSIRRKARILMTTLYRNKLSPYMLGMEGGSRFLVSRVISTLTSGGRGLPGN